MDGRTEREEFGQLTTSLTSMLTNLCRVVLAASTPSRMQTKPKGSMDLNPEEDRHAHAHGTAIHIRRGEPVRQRDAKVSQCAGQCEEDEDGHDAIPEKRYRQRLKGRAERAMGCANHRPCAVVGVDRKS